MEKEIKIMTADDLLKTRISITIEEIMDRFQKEDNHQDEKVFIACYLSNEVKLNLFNLGFKYRKHISPIGETCHIISLT